MKRLFQSVTVGLVPLIWVTSVSAVTCGGSGGVTVGTPGLGCTGTGNPIYDFLGFIINWIIRLLGAVAVLIIVSSPVFMVMSAGSPDGIKKTKSRLTNAVIGLILLSLTFVILKFIGVVQ